MQTNKQVHFVGVYGVSEPALEQVFGAIGTGRVKQDEAYLSTDGIAVIGIRGVMTKEGSPYGSGTDALTELVNEAAADDSVDAIFLDVESPGGQTAGVEALASAVSAAAAIKPVHGYAGDLAASAAYWALSKASHITTNKTGIVGSIGTYTVLTDYSKLAENMGVSVEVIKAGEFKGAGTPGTKITDSDKAHFQGVVNSINKVFKGDVQAGRSGKIVDIEAVADGSVYVGQEAKSAGFVDAVGTRAEAMRHLRSVLSTRGETMSEATVTAPKAATVSELESACPGASNDFIVAQLKAGATIEAATKAHVEALAAENKLLRDKAAQAEAAKKTDETVGVAAVGVGEESDEESSAESSTDANDRFNAIVRENMEKGMSGAAAYIKAHRTNPDLVAAMNLPRFARGIK